MWQRGQTLVEVLVALTAGVIVISAIVVVVVSSLNSVSFTKNQTVASQLVDQGMQIVRRMKDENWSTISQYASSGNTYCLAFSCNQIIDTTDDRCWVKSSFNGQCVNNISTASALFTRTVRLEDDVVSCNPPTPAGGSILPLNGIKATVTVSWTDNRCNGATDLCHSVESSSCFANLEAISSP